MSIQNAPLLTMLPSDIHYHCLTLLHPSEQELFGATCHAAKAIITNLWKKNGNVKEMKYCLLSTRRIKANFPCQFDTMTFQLPYLLLSSGLTYQTKEGVVRNAKCVFNWKTSALFFCSRSNDQVQLAGIVPIINEKSASTFNDYFYKPFSPHANAYFWSITTIALKPDCNVSASSYNFYHHISNTEESIGLFEFFFSELSEAKPAQIELSPTYFNPLFRYKAADPLFKMFEEERIKMNSMWLQNRKSKGIKKRIKQFVLGVAGL